MPVPRQHSPGDSEVSFLERIFKWRKKLLLVVNKVDLFRGPEVGGHDGHAVICYVEGHVAVDIR